MPYLEAVNQAGAYSSNRNLRATVLDFVQYRPPSRHLLDLVVGSHSLRAISGVTGARPSGKSAANASFTKSGAPRM